MRPARHSRLALAIAAVALLLAACKGSKDEPPAPPASAAPSARPPADPTTIDEACPDLNAAYFYRIEKNGKQSHVLGTRHRSVAWQKLPPIVGQAFDRAQVLVAEVAPEDQDPRPAQEPSTESLAAQLGPELWQRYRELAGDQLATAMEHQSPATASIALVAAYEDHSLQLDTSLKQGAKAAGKKIIGLETRAFQLQLVERLLDLRSLQQLLTEYTHGDKIRQRILREIQRYCSGRDETPGLLPDVRKRMLAFGYTDAELDQQDKEMLFDRNRTWVPKLQSLLVEGDVFVAVGADHLKGPQGILALLAAQGYTVTRLTPPPP